MLIRNEFFFIIVATHLNISWVDYMIILLIESVSIEARYLIAKKILFGELLVYITVPAFWLSVASKS